MKIEIDLMECPFCGRKAELIECSGGWLVCCYYSDPLNALEDSEGVCPVGPETILTLKDAAIRIWNRRAYTPQTPKKERNE